MAVPRSRQEYDTPSFEMLSQSTERVGAHPSRRRSRVWLRR